MSAPIRLTVVGSSPSVPRPGRACSSYLIETQTGDVVFDLGSGALGNLLAYRAPDAVGAIVVSHMHADHFLDLVPLRYALRYRSPRPRVVPLYLPPGGERMLAGIAATFHPEGDDEFFAGVFAISEYDPSLPLELACGTLRFAPTVHYVPSFAIRCDTAGASLTYSADTAPCDALVALAHGSDALLCESTLAPEEEADPGRGHLSAREAGATARAAGVRELLLTHYPAAIAATIEAEARTETGSRVTRVDDGAAFAIGA